MDFELTKSDVRTIKYLEKFGFRVEPKKECESRITLKVTQHGITDTVEFPSNDNEDANLDELNTYIDVYDSLMF